MPPPYPQSSTIFGLDLKSKFDIAAGQPANFKGPDEIKKFGYLINAFAQLSPKFAVQSYHGAACQVEFGPQPVFTRPSPRCELSDVMFIAFKGSQVRLSFMQVKATHTSLPLPAKIANCEQYAVLAKRPKITKWSTHNGIANWPDDVLKHALLPSVGTFGFFYMLPSMSCELLYSSASNLVNQATYLPTPSHKYVSGKFDANPLAINTVCGYKEVTRLQTLSDFGAALHAMEIGTPIDQGATAAANVPPNVSKTMTNCRNVVLAWIATKRSSPVLDALAEALGRRQGSGRKPPNDSQAVRSDDGRLPGARAIVVIDAGADIRTA